MLIILRHGQRSLFSAEQNPERRPAVVADGGFAVGELKLPDDPAFGQRVKILRCDGGCDMYDAGIVRIAAQININNRADAADNQAVFAGFQIRKISERHRLCPLAVGAGVESNRNLCGIFLHAKVKRFGVICKQLENRGGVLCGDIAFSDADFWRSACVENNANQHSGNGNYEQNINTGQL